jgi:hypothetical protein
MIKHNKKRNIGIIYELLLRHISNCLIEGRKNDAQKALTIIEKRFNKNTELYKEFRIFNALATSTVSGTHIAAAILQEAKDAIRRSDNKKLMKEKSSLIRDINHSLNDKNFYYRSIPEYTTYASIHKLISEWKKRDESNMANMFKYEKIVTSWLLNENKSIKVNKPIEADHLIFNIMTKKLNERYEKFNNEQKQILQNYALYNNEDHHDKMRNYLDNLKEITIKKVRIYKKESSNEIVNKKVSLVVESINKLNTEVVDDSLIAKFLMLSKLKEEIEV